MSSFPSSDPYTENYKRYALHERVAADTRQNMLRANIQPSCRWPLFLFAVDLVSFCILCWAFSDILNDMFARKHAERWLATSSASVGLAMYFVVILLRVRYLLQSGHSEYVRDIMWQFQQAMRTLLVIPVIIFSAFAWVSYRVQWNSASSLSLLIILFVAKQSNAYVAYRHYKNVSHHFFRLRFGDPNNDNGNEIPLHQQPTRFRFPTVPIVEPPPPAAANSTMYSTASMLLDETSGVETFHFSRQGASAVNHTSPNLPPKKNKGMSLKSPTRQPAGEDLTSRASLGSVEHSEDMVDYPYE